MQLAVGGTGAAPDRAGRDRRASGRLRVMLAAVVACAVAAWAAPAAQAAPFANGSFETPVVVPPVVAVPTSGTIAPWTVVSGTVDHGVTPFNGLPCNTAQCVHLRGTFPSVAPAALSQTFDTSPGAQCEARFRMSVRETTVPTLDVTVAGVTQSYTAIAAFAWEAKGIAFTPLTSSTTIRFTSKTSSEAGPRIDDVDMKCSAIQIPPKPDATLKICKVAGPGIPVGSLFKFAIGSGVVSVPAGPAPGGYCALAGTYSSAAPLTVAEASPGVLVDVTLASGQPFVKDLVGRKATFTPNPGMNVLTFTNAKGKTGYLEICKAMKSGKKTGKLYRFEVAGKTYDVPAGACSPPILVTPGTKTITEAPTSGKALLGCATPLDPTALLSCTPATRKAQVLVKPGDVSKETLVTFTNGNPQPKGVLEVCKVAGSGTPIGYPFSMDIAGTVVSVKAGPGPTGGCEKVAAYPVGTTVKVIDVLSKLVLWAEVGHTTTAVLVSYTPELDSSSVPASLTTTIKPGTTRVTFTNRCTSPSKIKCSQMIKKKAVKRA